MPRDTPSLQPSNIEAEQALLGALLLNNEVVDKLPAGFSGEMFYEPVHERIYDVATRLIAEGQRSDPVTMKLHLADDEGLKELGGTEYLARLAGATISISSARDYAELLRDLWVRRQGIFVMEEAMTRLAGHGDQGPPHVALEAVQGALATIAGVSSPRPLIHTHAAALTEAAHQTQAGFENKGEPLLSIGFKRIDKIIGGLMPADHIVIMGESSMGKTALALNIARKVCAQGHGVFIGSLEMPKSQIAQRMVSQELAARGRRVEYLRLMTGRVSEEEFRAALEAQRDMEPDPIVYAEDDASSLPRLMTAAHAAQRHLERAGTPLGLVVIDYLQLIQVPGAKGATEAVGTAARAMKTLAKQLGVPVVSLSQMNQENKARQNKRPQKGDARQSGEIEHSADVMIGLYRHAYYLDRDIQGESDPVEKSKMIRDLDRVKNLVEAIIIKNRRGPLETAHLYGDLPVNVIEDEPPGHQDQGGF